MALGRKTGGRKAGVPNKRSAAVKDALIQAFEELGGIPALVKWGRKSPDEFYKLWGRLMAIQEQRDLRIESESGGIKVIIRSVLDKGE